MDYKVYVGDSDEAKATHYEELLGRIEALIEQEEDWIAAMATTVCELHHGFDYFHWTGFYRTIGSNLLKIGPYQGSHGCLTIPFSKGVCGAAAQTQKTQLVSDVNNIKDHIACSATTRSEIVIPVISQSGETKAVLDIDSDLVGAFGAIDQRFLEKLCKKLAQKYFSR